VKGALAQDIRGGPAADCKAGSRRKRRGAFPEPSHAVPRRRRL